MMIDLGLFLVFVVKYQSKQYLRNEELCIDTHLKYEIEHRIFPNKKIYLGFICRDSI